VLGGERGLDEVVGDLLQRHRIVVQDAALADLDAVAVEEFDRILALIDAVLVEVVDGGDRQYVEQGEATRAQRQRLADRLVGEPAPAREPKAGKEARQRIPAVLHRLPGRRQRGIDPGVEAQPIDDPLAAAAVPEEPVVHAPVPRLSSLAGRRPRRTPRSAAMPAPARRPRFRITPTDATGTRIYHRRTAKREGNVSAALRHFRGTAEGCFLRDIRAEGVVIALAASAAHGRTGPSGAPCKYPRARGAGGFAPARHRLSSHGAARLLLQQRRWCR